MFRGRIAWLAVLLAAACLLAATGRATAEKKGKAGGKLFEEIRLTKNPVIDTDPVFSPDMKEIVFISVSNKEGRFSLHVMNADGSKRRVLLDVKGESHAKPLFFPDGERILFVFNRGDSSNFAVVKRDGKGRKDLTSLAGRVSSPAISPDGKRFAFILSTDRQYLYMYDMEEGKARKLVETENDCDSPVFSADGKQVFYCEFNENGTNICKVNVDGSRRRVLTSTGPGEGMDNVSPTVVKDGRVFYQSDVKAGYFQVWSMRPDGGDKKLVCDKEIFSFAVTPDGNYLVYLAALDFRNWEYFFYDIAAGKAKRITDNIYREKRPAISPDGKWLLYVSEVEGNPEIFKMRIAK